MDRLRPARSSFNSAFDSVDVKVMMYTSGRLTAIPSKPLGQVRCTAWLAPPQVFSFVPMMLSLCFELKLWSMRALY